MMVFQRMHLGIGKRNCKCYTVVNKVFKYSDSSNLESAGSAANKLHLDFQSENLHGLLCV